MFITNIINIDFVIVKDITILQLQKSVITYITKGCDYDRHFVLHFCSLQKVFWRVNNLSSTQMRQICVELAKLKFQDSSRPFMRKSFFCNETREIQEGKTSLSLSLSAFSTGWTLTHTLGLAVEHIHTHICASSAEVTLSLSLPLTGRELFSSVLRGEQQSALSHSLTTAGRENFLQRRLRFPSDVAQVNTATAWGTYQLHRLLDERVTKWLDTAPATRREVNETTRYCTGYYDE